MKSVRSSFLRRLGLVGFALAVAMPAVAEVEVIEITSQKRKSTLKETNIAITTWTAAQLEERQVEDMIDLREFVPNVSVETNANGNGFFVGSRGVAQADATLITRDPSVGVYIDGVYWGRTIGNLIDVLDIERIEVLRGPQGALYGRNTASGAVNFVTRKPSGSWGSKATVRAGSGEGPAGWIGDLRAYQEFPVFGAEGLDVPDSLGELSGSLSFASLNRDEWFNNLAGGPDTDGRKRLAGRMALHHEVGNFRATFASDYTYANEQGPEMQLTFLDAANANATGMFVVGAINGEQSPDRKRNLNILGSLGGVAPTQANGEGALANGEGAFTPAPGLRDDKTQAWGSSLTLEYDVDEVPLIGGSLLARTITGYRDVESDTYQDRDGAPADVFSNYLLDDVAQWTQEVNLIGETHVPGFDLEYVLGHFYLNEQGEQEAAQWAFGFFGSPASLSFPDIETNAHAVFGHFSFLPELGGWFENRVRAEFGIRQTWETKTVENSAINLTTNAALPAQFVCQTAGVTNLSYGWANCASGQTPVPAPVRGRKSFSELTPSGTLSLLAHDTTNTYITVGKGYTAGGFNGRANDPLELQTPYKEEVQLNVEGGLKFASPEGLLRLNVAAYWTKIEDMQRTQLTFVPGTTTVSSLVRNAADANVKGIEIEAVLNPIEGMFVDFAYGLADSEYETYCDLASSDLRNPGVPSADCAPGELDFANSRRLGNIPRHNISWGIGTTSAGASSTRSPCRTLVSSGARSSRRASTATSRAQRGSRTEPGALLGMTDTTCSTCGSCCETSSCPVAWAAPTSRSGAAT
jgi:iron complex outermembrane receptor protein